MRVLVTWGSKRGGTEGLARMVADALAREGFETSVEPAEGAVDLARFDGVVVGGALYANRWHRASVKFVKRHADELRSMPVWFFSSGPLDDTADRSDIPPTKQVRALMELVSAHGHATFGGRLAPDAHGFIASTMAKTRAGDFRDRGHVQAWADGIAAFLRAAAGQAREVLPLRRPASPALLASLCVLAGIGAISGGLGLVWSPDGSLMRLPLSLLDHTPFNDFLVPGLILAIVVGGISTLAGVLLLRRHLHAYAAAMAAGAVLMGWIAIEVLLLRRVEWLHGACFALGAAILSIAYARERSRREPRSTARSPSGAPVQRVATIGKAQTQA